MTKHYELLNYSEYGTVVDHVLYSCDCTRVLEEIKEEKTDKVIYVTKEEETSDLIKTILRKKEPPCAEEYAQADDKILCKCNIKPDTRINEHLEEGWEGSAIIAHGSTITFGCLMFVFNTLNTYVDR